MPKEGFHCICLPVTLIYYDFKIGKNYYLQVFLECKYSVKEKEMVRHITKDLEIYFDESDKSDPD